MRTLTMSDMEKHNASDACGTWLASFAGGFGVISAAVPPMAIGFAVLGALVGVGATVFCDSGDDGTRTYNPNASSRGPR